MKRYLVFMWEDYEAMGGINDNIDSFDYESDAIDCMTNKTKEDDCLDNGHVFDTKTMKIVYAI